MGTADAKARADTGRTKQKFDDLNKFATESGDAWLISVKGDRIVVLETLVDSDFADRLEMSGFVMTEIPGPHQRMVSNLTTEVITEGRKVLRTLHHAGMAETRQFSFALDS